MSHHTKAIAHQNPYFGSKLKIPKSMPKSILQITYNCCLKKPFQKISNIRKMGAFSNSAIMQRLYPMQNPHFGSKIKILKKHVKIHFTNHLQLFSAKNRSKKRQIFEK